MQKKLRPALQLTFTDKYKISITKNLYDGGEQSLEIERSKIIYENSGNYEFLEFPDRSFWNFRTGPRHCCGTVAGDSFLL